MSLCPTVSDVLEVIQAQLALILSIKQGCKGHKYVSEKQSSTESDSRIGRKTQIQQDYVGMSIIIGFCQTLSVSLPVLFSTVFAVLCKCDANKNLSNHKLASTKLAENEPPVQDVYCVH